MFALSLLTWVSCFVPVRQIKEIYWNRNWHRPLSNGYSMGLSWTKTGLLSPEARWRSSGRSSLGLDDSSSGDIRSARFPPAHTYLKLILSSLSTQLSYLTCNQHYTCWERGEGDWDRTLLCWECQVMLASIIQTTKETRIKTQLDNQATIRHESNVTNYMICKPQTCCFNIDNIDIGN